MDEPKRPPESSRPSVRPTFWISSTYFAEGFPYAIINSLTEILFRDIGATLTGVGLTSLFHLPWNLKFAWAPFMERTLSMRRWVVWLEFALAILFLAASLGLLFGETWIGQDAKLVLFSALFLAAAFASASHDVAIDAYYLEAQNRSDQARFVGLRSAAYKVASILVRGPALPLVAAIGWAGGLGSFALILAGLGLFHAWALRGGGDSTVPSSAVARPIPSSMRGGPRRWRRLVLGASFILLIAIGLSLLVTESPKLSAALSLLTAGSTLSWLLAGAVLLGIVFARKRLRAMRAPGAFARLLGEPHFPLILSFVVSFRLGESFLQKMKWPFLSESIGLTKSEYGTLNGTIGVFVSFLGLILGGRLIAKDGLERWFWPFLLAQNVLNLLYALLAGVPRGWMTHELDLWAVGGVIVLEEFGAGLGAAVLMVFLMRLCRGEHRASEYALLTAVMTFGFTIAGALSGYVAESFGYVGFFVTSFVLTLPMMVLASGALKHSSAFGVDGLPASGN